jgi:hypothetical protein
MRGTFAALEPLPAGDDTLRLATVAAVVTEGAVPAWRGEFTATVTIPTGRRIYAFGFRQGADLYDVVVRFPYDANGPGSIAIAKNSFNNVVGRGECRAPTA